MWQWPLAARWTKTTDNRLIVPVRLGDRPAAKPGISGHPAGDRVLTEGDRKSKLRASPIPGGAEVQRTVNPLVAKFPELPGSQTQTIKLSPHCAGFIEKFPMGPFFGNMTRHRPRRAPTLLLPARPIPWRPKLIPPNPNDGATVLPGNNGISRQGKVCAKWIFAPSKDWSASGYRSRSEGSPYGLLNE